MNTIIAIPPTDFTYLTLNTIWSIKRYHVPEYEYSQGFTAESTLLYYLIQSIGKSIPPESHAWLWKQLSAFHQNYVPDYEYNQVYTAFHGCEG